MDAAIKLMDSIRGGGLKVSHPENNYSGRYYGGWFSGSLYIFENSLRLAILARHAYLCRQLLLWSAFPA